LCRDAPDILISVIGRLGKNIQNVNRALGLYANSFSALEREDLDTAIIDDLNNPAAELRDFAIAFRRLAHHIVLERRRRNELASAAMIQQAMVPQTLADLDEKGRCDLFGGMKTAREVGGDLYDAVMLDENRLMLVIGDVCGKGVPASLFMSTAMTIIRLAALQSRDICATMEWANTMLFAQNASSLFATVFYGVLDLDTGRLDYANCGHNPPFVLQRGGSCFKLAGGGLPLGIFPKKALTVNSIELSPGDSVFLYTDGITESIDALGAEYGDARLTEILKQAQGGDAEALCRSVLGDVAAFTKGVDQFDDITCLAVRFGRPGQS
jgi:sigma-B regulation protein RsbU (phosphoserine phosphatase)